MKKQTKLSLMLLLILALLSVQTKSTQITLPDTTFHLYIKSSMVNETFFNITKFNNSVSGNGTYEFDVVEGEVFLWGEEQK